MVQREEVDMALSFISRRYERTLVADFTRQYSHDPTTMIVPGSQPLPAWIGVIK